MEEETPRARARRALTEAVRDRDAAREAASARESEVRTLMKDAESVGVTLAEIATITGYHRNYARKIIGERER